MIRVPREAEGVQDEAFALRLVQDELEVPKVHVKAEGADVGWVFDDGAPKGWDHIRVGGREGDRLELRLESFKSVRELACEALVEVEGNIEVTEEGETSGGEEGEVDFVQSDAGDAEGEGTEGGKVEGEGGVVGRESAEDKVGQT